MGVSTIGFVSSTFAPAAQMTGFAGVFYDFWYFHFHGGLLSFPRFPAATSTGLCRSSRWNFGHRDLGILDLGWQRRRGGACYHFFRRLDRRNRRHGNLGISIGLATAISCDGSATGVTCGLRLPLLSALQFFSQEKASTLFSEASGDHL